MLFTYIYVYTFRVYSFDCILHGCIVLNVHLFIYWLCTVSIDLYLYIEFLSSLYHHSVPFLTTVPHPLHQHLPHPHQTLYLVRKKRVWSISIGRKTILHHLLNMPRITVYFRQVKNYEWSIVCFPFILLWGRVSNQKLYLLTLQTDEYTRQSVRLVVIVSGIHTKSRIFSKEAENVKLWLNV